MFLLLALNIIARAAENRPGDQTVDVIIGIDLGVMFSNVAAIYQYDTEPVVVTFEENKQNYPSTLMYTGVDEGTILEEVTGWRAVANYINKPNMHNYIYGFNRFIGISGKEGMERDLIVEIMETVTYEIEVKVNKDNPNEGTVYMLIKNSNNEVIKRVSSIEACSAIFSGMKKYFKKPTEEIKALVVTTPFYFTDNQKEDIVNAIAAAQLPIDEILIEPLAAAFAYIHENNIREGRFFVFNFGGWSFDTSIVEYADGLLGMEICSGKIFKGGENVNEVLIRYFYKLFSLKKIKLKPQEIVRFIKMIDDLKVKLCNAQNLLNNRNIEEDAKVSSTFLYQNDQMFTMELNTSLFNSLCIEFFNEIEKCVKDFIELYENEGGKKDDIQKVLLVGGSSNIPWVREMLARIFGKELIDNSLDPANAIAKGAAYYGAFLTGQFSYETAPAA